jgi:hypothetical protein
MFVITRTFRAAGTLRCVCFVIAGADVESGDDDRDEALAACSVRPLPLVGESWREGDYKLRSLRLTPLPSPLPQGEREQTAACKFTPKSRARINPPTMV